MSRKNFFSKKGMALLLAIIITTAALSLALGINSLLIGQLKLGQSARDSQIAFSAADAGKECALFYLWRATDSPGTSFWSPVNPCNDQGVATSTSLTRLCQIECYGTLLDVTYRPPASGLSTDEHRYTFRAQTAPDPSADASPFWDRSTGVCADVDIRAQIFTCPLPSLNYPRTVIESSGYSYCSGSISGGVNRTLRVVEREGTDKCPTDTL